MKSVLLDAITHDFRSPLTSIKASVTGLLDDLEFDREQRRELLTIINEECDRINRPVGEAAEIARLESVTVSGAGRMQKCHRKPEDLSRW